MSQVQSRHSQQQFFETPQGAVLSCKLSSVFAGCAKRQLMIGSVSACCSANATANYSTNKCINRKQSLMGLLQVTVKEFKIKMCCQLKS